MSVFAIADLHLSFGSDKPMEVFGGWENHIWRLQNNWNKIVNENDSVVIAGDISWAMRLDSAKQDFDFINNSLNGKKYIVKGNHDYWWTTAAKMNRFLAENKFDNIKIVHNNAFRCENTVICGTRGWFYDSVKEDEKVLLREAQRLKTSIECGLSLRPDKNAVPTVFLHYPPVYDNYVCDEIMEVLIRYRIKRCFYGHLHGKAIYCAYTGDYNGVEMRLISSDSLRFTPFLVE